jgi:tRNA(Ile)-lysidine synthase
MLKRFKSFIVDKKLFTSGENILLAVSGGIDSMVMTHLFMKAGFDIAIAHLNHNQRGEESVSDAQFVRDFAVKYDILYFQKDVDFSKVYIPGTSNFQEMARIERYRWFEEICHENDIQKIATAHHKNDEVEGFIFNLSRKSGLKGLSGIPVKRNNIIRPLLFSNRIEIEEYAARENIEYQEDSSNSNNNYTRNFIRNKVLPQLIELNPKFINNASHSIINLQDTQKLLDYLLDQYGKEVINKSGDIIKIRMKELYGLPIIKALLFELIKEYGYNYDQIEDMVKSRTTGSLFYSATHKAVLDRDDLIIKSRTEFNKVNLEVNETTIVEGLGLLKLESLEFPLRLRNWEPGDQFHPLGMEGSQKVKDFLTNNKVDRFEKEKALVLCSGDQICWVVGWRMDNYFKLSKSSKKVLRIEWNPNV